MDIFFQDPTDIPLPPDEVRILQFRAEPWPDNRRVRVHLEIAPFQKRPNAEIQIQDPEGAVAANLTIVETIDRKMEFTVHLRGERRDGVYIASATVYYAEPEAEPGGAAASDQDSDQEKPAPPLPTRITVVDEAETRFEITGR